MMEMTTVEVMGDFNCFYDENENSFLLNGQKLNDLIDTIEISEVGFLPIENSIQTPLGILTWTLNAGWIVVPSENGRLNWGQFETLQNALKKNNFPISELIVQKLNSNIEGFKLRYAREYLDELNQYLKDIDQIINTNQQINLDNLTLLIKDFRTSDTTELTHIKNEIQKEIYSVKHFIEKNKY